MARSDATAAETSAESAEEKAEEQAVWAQYPLVAPIGLRVGRISAHSEQYARAACDPCERVAVQSCGHMRCMQHEGVRRADEQDGPSATGYRCESHPHVPFPKCTVGDALALALAARAGAGKALCALCLCCAAAAHRVRPQPMPLVRNRRMGRTMQS